MFDDRSAGSRIEFEIETGGKPDRPQHAQVVFAEAPVRVADCADDAGIEIAYDNAMDQWVIDCQEDIRRAIPVADEGEAEQLRLVCFSSKNAISPITSPFLNTAISIKPLPFEEAKTHFLFSSGSKIFTIFSFVPASIK